MKPITAVGFALAVALLGSLTPSTVLAQDRNVFLSGNESAQMDRGDRDYNRGDRTERWRDRTRVDGIDLEGRWIMRRGPDLKPDAGSRWGNSPRVATLPQRLVIDQRRHVIRVEDFRGRLVQQIEIRDHDQGGDRDLNRDGHVIGFWRDSKLVTVQSGFRGARIIQTFAVANRGRTLVVNTRQDGRGTRHDVEFTSVYQRV